ncbi:Gfo/Idh/MocA family protein [Oceanobacillus bengalensis]|uniref:Gfo/Idh/MocA family oxidoreductase n=1 Tax=Oceanobacillus bengalensis TaxID=1435466 RepID=A0A494Z2Z8_9BACI|nr:Gfo/Idh/MocA family oxidoreductase [Oceanobacillus bengalensis]RKQ16896.1 gfo/Idh/MocA family oxidoreductase [Oceanobacillus bengalensis]
MKYSTIGTSWITESFINAVKHTREAELSSIYSRSVENAERFAKRNGAENAFTSIEDMLNEETDFIYIASPNTMHYEHIKLAIKHKKHVFCEKPMVLNEREWEEIYELAEKENVFVFEGFRHLYSPNYKIFKEALEEIGSVRSGVLQYIKYSSRYDVLKDGKETNVFSKEFAGGALMDLGVYPLSMAIDLFGEPKDMNYFPVLLSNGIDGSGTIVLTYDTFIITILCSKIAQGLISSEIHGEDGTVTVDSIAPINSISVYNRKAQVSKELAKEQLALDMVYEVKEFIRIIKDNDNKCYQEAMERSRIVARCLHTLRMKQGTLLFPGESIGESL